NTPNLYTSTTGENFNELQERVLESLEEIKKQHREGNVLIVTHTVVIKALLAHFKKNTLKDLWLPPFIRDTSLTIVEIDDQRFSIALEGDTSHVKQLQDQKVNQ
ncbi:MAG: histidine phosphatase family protein, partial [Planococcus donghaensis]